MPRSIYDAQAHRPGPFPEVGTVLAGWTSTMTFKKLTKVMSNGEVIDSETAYPCEGIFQPLTSRDLIAKPEGERSWKWATLWTRIDYNIQNGDDIEDKNGMIYKVMKSQDWSGAGYYQFDIVQDYITK